MTDEHTYYLGVDGGASKTTALVTDENGSPLGDGLAGPSNHLRVGIETASRNVERAVNKALVAADVTSREIVWAYCGIAGADHPAHRQEVVDSLSIFSREATSPSTTTHASPSPAPSGMAVVWW